MTPKVTIDQFKQLARDVGPVVSAVLAARVFAEAERTRVDAYIRPIFQSYKFKVREDWRDRLDRYPDGIITDPKDLYLCNDDGADGDELRMYYEECDQAHRAHGFDGPKGHCPALVAESLVRTAEQALIDMAAPTFGIDGQIYGDHRGKFLELLIGAAVQAGNVRNLFKESR